jgi:hypothetical protein
MIDSNRPIIADADIIQAQHRTHECHINIFAQKEEGSRV